MLRAWLRVSVVRQRWGRGSDDGFWAFFSVESAEVRTPACGVLVEMGMLRRVKEMPADVVSMEGVFWLGFESVDLRGPLLGGSMLAGGLLWTVRSLR